MNTAVRYYTKTGNTEKLAKAVAKAVSTEAKSVAEDLEQKVAILFLGSSVYAGGVDEQVKAFVKRNADKIGLIVNFSTAALVKSTYTQVKKLANENNVKICDEEFHCRGAFSVIHRDQPNAEDLQNAVIFSESIVKKYLK